MFAVPLSASAVCRLLLFSCTALNGAVCIYAACCRLSTSCFNCPIKNKNYVSFQAVNAQSVPLQQDQVKLTVHIKSAQPGEATAAVLCPRCLAALQYNP